MIHHSDHLRGDGKPTRTGRGQEADRRERGEDPEEKEHRQLGLQPISRRAESVAFGREDPSLRPIEAGGVIPVDCGAQLLADRRGPHLCAESIPQGSMHRLTLSLWCVPYTGDRRGEHRGCGLACGGDRTFGDPMGPQEATEEQ
jgi:hypothetical protein